MDKVYGPVIANHPRYPWDDELRAWHVKDMDKVRVWVHPMLATVALIVGSPGSLRFTDQWCYLGTQNALNAAEAWQGPYPGSEPAGWYKHPGSGRRRPHGDPTGEHILW